MRFVCLFVSALVASALLAAGVNAQTMTSGALTGVITDSSGAVLPDVHVEIKDSAKGTVQSTRTDRQGIYRFVFLSPGNYAVRVTHVGFQETSRLVTVSLGTPVSLNLRLAIAEPSTSVSVISEAPILQAENGDVSSTTTQKQISELPNPGNDLTYVAQIAPGVVMNTDSQGAGNFSMFGMPSTSTLITVNGMNDRDNGSLLSNTGSLNLLLGQNQVQEATVVGINYSGQFGGSAGGYVNYITKSGSNEWHGNAQYYWNGRFMNANSWLNNATGVKRPFDNANQWAASLGGPAKRDKLFFFLDTEGVRVLLPQTYLLTIPSPQFEAATIANIDSRFGPSSASDAFYKKIFALYNLAPGASSAQPGGWSPASDPTGCTGFTRLGPGVPCAVHNVTNIGIPSADALISGRLDWNLSTRDRAFLQLQYDSSHTTLVDPINSMFDFSVKQPWWTGQINETHTFSSTAASQFLIGGSYIGYSGRLSDPARALAAFPTSLGFFASGTYSTLGAFNYTGSVNTGRPTTQFQISEDIFKTKGKHNLGFGGNLLRTYWTTIYPVAINNEVPNSYAIFNGTLVPQTLDAFYQGGVDPASPNIDATQLQQSFAPQSSERIRFLGVGMYGQDQWRARPNLTLTLAVRGEHYSNPVCEPDCFARLTEPFAAISHDPAQPYNKVILADQRNALPSIDAVLWSPRFSFAWQPFSFSPNTVLRGGVGIFYDPLLGNIASWLADNPPRSNFYTAFGDNLSPNETTNLFADAAASNAAFVNGFNSGETLAQIQSHLPTGFAAPAIATPAGTIHPPQYQRWSLELQQAFGTNASVKVLYTGNHGIHEFYLDPNANAWGFGSLPPALCTSPPVPPCADPRFSQVNTLVTSAVSNYNGAVVSFLRRWGAGFLQANYTYSHAFDEVSNGGQAVFTRLGEQSPQDPYNLRGAYGPADYDVRHSFNASYVWEVPLKRVFGDTRWDSLLSEWQVAGTIFGHSGFPYTAYDQVTSFALTSSGFDYFGELLAVPSGSMTTGIPCGASAAHPSGGHPCLPPQALPNGSPNPNAAFVQAGCETGFNKGNLPGPSGPCSGPAVSIAQGRNRFRGPGYFNTDLTVMKDTKLPYREATLGIGLEFYNLLNHPNFGLPGADVSNPSLGQILYMSQPPTTVLGAGSGVNASARMIRIKAEFKF
jgi:hypothetical protein